MNPAQKVVELPHGVNPGILEPGERYLGPVLHKVAKKVAEGGTVDNEKLYRKGYDAAFKLVYSDGTAGKDGSSDSDADGHRQLRTAAGNPQLVLPSADATKPGAGHAQHGDKTPRGRKGKKRRKDKKRKASARPGDGTGEQPAKPPQQQGSPLLQGGEDSPHESVASPTTPMSPTSFAAAEIARQLSQRAGPELAPLQPLPQHPHHQISFNMVADERLMTPLTPGGAGSAFAHASPPRGKKPGRPGKAGRAVPKSPLRGGKRAAGGGKPPKSGEMPLLRISTGGGGDTNDDDELESSGSDNSERETLRIPKMSELPRMKSYKVLANGIRRSFEVLRNSSLSNPDTTSPGREQRVLRMLQGTVDQKKAIEQRLKHVLSENQKKMHSVEQELTEVKAYYQGVVEDYEESMEVMRLTLVVMQDECRAEAEAAESGKSKLDEVVRAAEARLERRHKKEEVAWKFERAALNSKMQGVQDELEATIKAKEEGEAELMGDLQKTESRAKAAESLVGQAQIRDNERLSRITELLEAAESVKRGAEDKVKEVEAACAAKVAVLEATVKTALATVERYELDAEDRAMSAPAQLPQPTYDDSRVDLLESDVLRLQTALRDAQHALDVSQTEVEDLNKNAESLQQQLKDAQQRITVASLANTVVGAAPAAGEESDQQLKAVMQLVDVFVEAAVDILEPALASEEGAYMAQREDSDYDAKLDVTLHNTRAVGSALAQAKGEFVSLQEKYALEKEENAALRVEVETLHDMSPHEKEEIRQAIIQEAAIEIEKKIMTDLGKHMRQPFWQRMEECAKAWEVKWRKRKDELLRERAKNMERVLHIIRKSSKALVDAHALWYPSTSYPSEGPERSLSAANCTPVLPTQAKLLMPAASDGHQRNGSIVVKADGVLSGAGIASCVAPITHKRPCSAAERLFDAAVKRGSRAVPDELRQRVTQTPPLPPPRDAREPYMDDVSAAGVSYRPSTSHCHLPCHYNRIRTPPLVSKYKPSEPDLPLAWHPDEVPFLVPMSRQLVGVHQADGRQRVSLVASPGWNSENG